jgi:ATP phosphoribosyltransferase
LKLLTGSDIQFRQQHRLDISLVKNHDIALVFLPADEIPAYVAEGRVDLGITGRDVVKEYMTSLEAMDGHEVHELMDLGFGRCRLMVQVPETGTYQKPEDLIGKNIVTSFDGLTEEYFAKLEGIQIDDDELRRDPFALKRRLKTRIKYASGSVEAACPLGRADGIVDLVGKHQSTVCCRRRS